jgi:hypothetical protein
MASPSDAEAPPSATSIGSTALPSTCTQRRTYIQIYRHKIHHHVHEAHVHVHECMDPASGAAIHTTACMHFGGG